MNSIYAGIGIFFVLLLVIYLIYHLRNKIRSNNLVEEIKEGNTSPTRKLEEHEDKVDFADILSHNLVAEANKISSSNSIKLNSLLKMICSKFQELNVALKNSSKGQELVAQLKEKIKQQGGNVDDDIDEKEPTSKDLEQVIDTQENLIYIIYPTLLREK